MLPLGGAVIRFVIASRTYLLGTAYSLGTIFINSALDVAGQITAILLKGKASTYAEGVGIKLIAVALVFKA